MVSENYKEAGYEYVIVDDCWADSYRDPNTNELVADRERFPNGMKSVVDYVSIVMSLENDEITSFQVYSNRSTN